VTDQNVPPEQPVSEPSVWADAAAELHKLSDGMLDLVGEPAAGGITLAIQPRGADGFGRSTVKGRPGTIAAVDAVAYALLGKPSADQRMHDGTFHRSAYGTRGPVTVQIYTSVADPDAVDPEMELARLRAENERLRGALGGLAYSREPDDPTPVSPARVPAHTGGMTEDGLIDETEAEQVTVYFSFGHGQTDPDTGKNLLDHYVTVVGPDYVTCRQAMIASRYGQAWAFDYIKGSPTADEWIPQWTEHERITATAADL
jgi:hypothetical protein